VTGRKAALQAEAHAEELKTRAAQMSTVTVASVPDYDEEPSGSEVAVGGVEVGTPTKKLRVNSDLEDLTFGVGKNYNFYRGQTYTVPTQLWEHLERLGYVWH
jgi:hypothetical protein